MENKALYFEKANQTQKSINYKTKMAGKIKKI